LCVSVVVSRKEGRRDATDLMSKQESTSLRAGDSELKKSYVLRDDTLDPPPNTRTAFPFRPKALLSGCWNLGVRFGRRVLSHACGTGIVFEEICFALPCNVCAHAISASIGRGFAHFPMFVQQGLSRRATPRVLPQSHQLTCNSFNMLITCSHAPRRDSS